ADYMVELGPGSGEKGGQLVISGPISRIAESPLTGAYLTGAREIPVPSTRRRLGPRSITLTGAPARNHNVLDTSIPLGSVPDASGRCATCEGAGYLEVEMVFMADVFVPCDDCAGRRFKPAVLDVRVNGRNIYEVLELTVDEAIRFFPREEKLGQALWQLQQVGLGYLRLGQPATTLSGGEAQRLKIARELALTSKKAGKKLYIMDEPTTGLHLEDIRRLAQVFDRLVDAGHTLVLIEHNLDVIKLADWIIDLGPDAGDRGGQVVASGRP